MTGFERHLFIFALVVVAVGLAVVAVAQALIVAGWS